MKSRRICACLLAGPLLAGPLLAGCGTAGVREPVTGHVTAKAAGHVTGKLVMAGGPLGPGGQQPRERPLPGTVTFTAGHRTVSVKVGTAGTFSVLLPPGRYQVSGRSPSVLEVDGATSRELPCSQPTAATVTAGHTATVTVACIVP
jgi:hypothetical protein